MALLALSSPALAALPTTLRRIRLAMPARIGKRYSLLQDVPCRGARRAGRFAFGELRGVFRFPRASAKSPWHRDEPLRRQVESWQRRSSRQRLWRNRCREFVSAVPGLLSHSRYPDDSSDRSAPDQNLPCLTWPERQRVN